MVIDDEPVGRVDAAVDPEDAERPGEPIEVSSDYHRLEIHFTALSFSAPERVRYRHRLIGLSDLWETPEEGRIARFRGLPSGDYRFEVEAANEAGIWSREPARLAIRVPTPWWRTVSFKTILGGCAIFGVACGYSLRVRRLQRRAVLRQEYTRRLLEHDEQERRRLAKELHDGLGQDLLIIRNQATLLGREWVEAPPHVGQRLRELTEAARAAIEQARNLAHNLRPAELERVGLTAALEAMIERASGSSLMTFRPRLENLDGALSRDAEVTLYRISQELVNNVLKHSGAQSCDFSLRRLADGTLELAVSDDGRGFDPDLNRSGSAPAAPRGLGFDNVRERVEMLSGTHRVESSPGAGVHWLIRIPPAPKGDAGGGHHPG